MRGKIILIGTSHTIQCGSDECSLESIQQFRAYIKECCQSNGIRLVAEEMSCSGLLYHKVDASVAQELASELNISYLATDLDQTERLKLGIDDYSLGIASSPSGTQSSDPTVRDLLRAKVSDPLRECCWFARILEKDIWPTLFICGADHLGNMVTLMQSVNQDVIVAHRDYER